MVQITKRNVEINKEKKNEPKAKTIKTVFIALPCRTALHTVQVVEAVNFLPYRVFAS